MMAAKEGSTRAVWAPFRGDHEEGSGARNQEVAKDVGVLNHEA